MKDLARLAGRQMVSGCDTAASFASLFGLFEVLAAVKFLPSWPTVISAILGFVGGFQVGDWVASQVGWAGECHESELEARGAYLCVLASAAWADGVVSTKERQLILAAAKRVLTEVGYGEACDADRAIDLARAQAVTPQDAAAYVSQLAPPMQQYMLADVLSILYSECRGASGPAATNEGWLDVFRQSAQIADWSLLELYDRRYDVAGGGCGSRVEWLAELGLADGANDDEVRAAYRRKASEYHPDRHQGLAPQIRSLTEAKLTKVADAYRRLLDRDRTGASGPLFVRDIHTGQAIVPCPSQQVTCQCWLCGKNNRLPAEAVIASARCGNCHALLATTIPSESSKTDTSESGAASPA